MKQGTLVNWQAPGCVASNGEFIAELPSGRAVIAVYDGRAVGPLMHISTDILKVSPSQPEYVTEEDTLGKSDQQQQQTTGTEGAAPSKLPSLGGAIALVALTMMLFLTGCASGGTQAPPTALDRQVFNIQTNTVTQTNVVLQTNIVSQVVTTTNTQNQVVFQTNLIPVSVPVPQVVTTTNYVFTPSTTTPLMATANIVGAAAGPWGTVGLGALSLILGVWGSIRSKTATSMTAVAQNSTQALAVARATIAALPNGSALAAKFDTWLSQHQQDADIAQELAGVVDSLTSDGNTSTIASGIISQLTTPLPTAAAPKPTI